MLLSRSCQTFLTPRMPSTRPLLPACSCDGQVRILGARAALNGTMPDRLLHYPRLIQVQRRR